MYEFLAMLDPKDWVTVLAALLGPVLAVQAQTWVERARASKARREHVFQVLMATRAARLSPEHVRALNMIELTFYGARTFGGRLRSKKNQDVLTAWSLYMDHLNQELRGQRDDAINRWVENGTQLFFDLLEKMAVALGYHVDRVSLKRQSYIPLAHGNIEEQNEEVRRRVLELLAGDSALKMEITNIPVAANNN